ncbi:MAG: ammonium transporter [Gemmatimonadota bacterium]|nr:ammonium transporter [Gemmatimonadota bacterium]
MLAGAQVPAAAPPAIVSADTAWMLMSTALVLLMTPACGFFYGGLVRAKNALNTMMMCLGSLAVVGVTWALVGYTLSFNGTNRWIGGLGNLFLNDVGLEARGTIPHLLFMSYQGTFAVVTAVLIAGAVVERMRFGAYLAFIGVWSLVIYAPLAHWVWGGGWLGQLGVLDFAGGTVVHINAGVAATVAAVLVGQRKDFGRQAVLPHNVPFVLLGSILLYFGWFGFNAGSALAANGAAALAFTNTMLAPMAALAVWMALDSLRTQRATAVGAATALVVGLVVITPAAGFVSPLSALAIGALGAMPSYFGILWRSRTRLDDSLDVLAGHGVGGVSGALLTGVFADARWGGTNGLLFGHPGQLALQAVGVLATIVYSAVGTFVVLKAVGLLFPLRATTRAEGVGMDITQHGEEAYAEGEGAVLVFRDASAPQHIAQPLTAKVGTA